MAIELGPTPAPPVRVPVGFVPVGIGMLVPVTNPVEPPIPVELQKALRQCSNRT